MMCPREHVVVTVPAITYKWVDWGRGVGVNQTSFAACLLACCLATSSLLVFFALGLLHG